MTQPQGGESGEGERCDARCGLHGPHRLGCPWWQITDRIPLPAAARVRQVGQQQ